MTGERPATRKTRTPLRRFAARLVRALKTAEIPAEVRSEADLERRVLIPRALAAAAAESGVRVFVHPFGSRRRCVPDCESVLREGGQVVPGRPRCWRRTKADWSVAAFGTHHTFDLVAADATERLALELKFVAVRGTTMPNGEIQRFLGQCALAASKHPLVIGVFVHRGPMNPRWTQDTSRVRSWAARLGIHLVFRAVE